MEDGSFALDVSFSASIRCFFSNFALSMLKRCSQVTVPSKLPSLNLQFTFLPLFSNVNEQSVSESPLTVNMSFSFESVGFIDQNINQTIPAIETSAGNALRSPIHITRPYLLGTLNCGGVSKGRGPSNGRSGIRGFLGFGWSPLISLNIRFEGCLILSWKLYLSFFLYLLLNFLRLAIALTFLEDANNSPNEFLVSPRRGNGHSSVPLLES